jgi:hypothetical protein
MRTPVIIVHLPAVEEQDRENQAPATVCQPHGEGRSLACAVGHTSQRAQGSLSAQVHPQPGTLLCLAQMTA